MEGDMGHIGGLINPRPWRGRCRAGYSNTGEPPLPRKRAPCQKRHILQVLRNLTQNTWYNITDSKCLKFDCSVCLTTWSVCHILWHVFNKFQIDLTRLKNASFGANLFLLHPFFSYFWSTQLIKWSKMNQLNVQRSVSDMKRTSVNQRSWSNQAVWASRGEESLLVTISFTIF